MSLPTASFVLRLKAEVCPKQRTNSRLMEGFYAKRSPNLVPVAVYFFRILIDPCSPPHYHPKITVHLYHKLLDRDEAVSTQTSESLLMRLRLEPADDVRGDGSLNAMVP